VDQHLQRRRSLHEDGTPQILLITPSEKKLGHHITLTIWHNIMNRHETTCQIAKKKSLLSILETKCLDLLLIYEST